MSDSRQLWGCIHLSPLGLCQAVSGAAADGPPQPRVAAGFAIPRLVWGQLAVRVFRNLSYKSKHAAELVCQV